MKFKYGYFFGYALLIFLVAVATAQHTNKKNSFTYVKETLTEDFKHVFSLGKNIIQRPLTFNQDDFTKIGLTAALTSTLFIYDPDIKHIALRNRTSVRNKIFTIDDYFNGTSAFYSSFAIYLAGFVFKDKTIRKAGLNALETLLISQSVTSSLKHFFGRRRPYAGKDHMDFKIFRGKKGKYRALPSGHTTSAFAFASVMALSVDNLPWKIFWYSGASMVGFARVYNNVHWFSDTVLATIITYNIASYVVNFDKVDKDDKTPLNNLSIGFNPAESKLSIILKF